MAKILDPTRKEMLARLKLLRCEEFDCESAIFWFAYHHHAGQSSNLYYAMCETPYHPGPNVRGPEGIDAEIAYDILRDEYIVEE